MKDSNFDKNYSEGIFPIIEIPKDTNYWIMRASGGKYSKDFELNDRITLDSENLDIEKVKSDYDNFRKIFREHRLKEVEHNSNLSDTAQSITISSKKIFNFIHSMKNGDIVLVPTHQSRSFLVGIITKEAKQYNDISNAKLISKFEGEAIPVSKDKFYREVSWINKVPRYKVDSSLLYTLTMHQTLIKIEENTNHINSLLTPLYIKSGRLNLSLRVNKSKRISSETWENFYNYLNKSKNVDEDIAVKTNVQSPGVIDLSALISGVPDSNSLLLLLLFLSGGEVEYKNLNFKINGLLHFAKDKLFKSKRNNSSETESEISNTSNTINEQEQYNGSINLNFNELNESQKESLRNMIQTLDLSIDDVQKLTENTIANSNENEHE
ncbi:hypothetical protein RJB83_03185 [Staphylococcus epidermidis]|nr:hypothetical protein [Staphylococcus epidermidis]